MADILSYLKMGIKVDVYKFPHSVIDIYALQFGSLEEFQEEFKDINQEEQISRLHKMLAPHLLRSINLRPFSNANFFLQLIFRFYLITVWYFSCLD